MKKCEREIFYLKNIDKYIIMYYPCYKKLTNWLMNEGDKFLYIEYENERLRKLFEDNTCQYKSLQKK